MSWDDDIARSEYRWLHVASRFKYDRYRDFVAGSRFLEHLLIWLGQFKPGEERDAAYRFIRHKIVYFGPAEIKKLVELFYFDEVRPNLVRHVSSQAGIKPQLIWADEESSRIFDRIKRQTLFMGLSDGAHMELLRYAAKGALSNEQIVGTTQVDVEKWSDLRNELRKELEDTGAVFTTIYAIDDFSGSGTSLIRRLDGQAWKGKLVKLRRSILAAEDELAESIFAADFELHVHHYIASYQARCTIDRRLKEVASDPPDIGWFPNVIASYGMALPESRKLDETRDADYLVVFDRYYDPAIEHDVRRHLEECGVDNLRRGYSGCSLPLVLDHNTPNNSIPLLWVESPGVEGPPMRPLFRRRQRHMS